MQCGATSMNCGASFESVSRSETAIEEDDWFL